MHGPRDGSDSWVVAFPGRVSPYAILEIVEKPAEPIVVVLDDLAPLKLLHPETHILVELLLPGLQVAQGTHGVNHQFCSD